MLPAGSKLTLLTAVSCTTNSSDGTPFWFLIYTVQSTKAPIAPTTEPMIPPSTRRDAPAVGGGACAFSGAEAHSGDGAGGNAESGDGTSGNAESGAGATAGAGVVGRPRTAITTMYSFWPFWHRSSSLLMKKNWPDRSSLNTEILPLLPTAAWSRRTGLRVLHASKSCSVTSSTESTPSSCVNTASQEEDARTSCMIIRAQPIHSSGCAAFVRAAE